MSQLLKDWKVLAVVAVLIGLIVWFIYSQGKKAATGPQVPPPGGTEAIPKGWSPEPLAKQLHSALNDIFVLASTKEDVFKQLYTLPTDAMLAVVYNTFNRLYFGEGYGTMTDWIRDEFNTVPEMLGGYYGRLLSRLTQLSLP